MIQFDRLGQLVPPGKVARTLAEPFLNASAVPSWMEVNQGTATFPAIGTNGTRGGLTVTSGTTNGNQAKIRTSFDIDLRNVAGVLWEMQGLALSSYSNVDIGMGIGGAAGYIRHTYSANQVEMNLNNTFVNMPYQLRNSGISGVDEATHRRNIGLLSIYKSEIQTDGSNYIYLYFLADDQVIGWRRAPIGVGTVVVRPDLTVTTRESAAKSFNVEQVKLTVFTE